MANSIVTSTLSLGPTSVGPMAHNKGGHLLTLKQYKQKQSVTPIFSTKFDGKSNGNINLEFGAQQWCPKAPHKGGHLLTWKQFKLKQIVTPKF